MPRPLTLSAVAVLAALGCAATASAATITVDTKSDAFDGNKCSLRDAIESANQNAKSGKCAKGSGADTIVIPSGNYKLTLTGADEDVNASGDLDVLEPLTIEGAGSTKTTIDGNAAETEERILHIVNGDKFTLRDLTLRDGLENNSVGAGGVFSDSGDGAMKIERVRAVNNTGYYGGGVSMYGSGKLTVSNSTIAENDAADGYTGGIYSYQNDVVIKNTKIDGNAGDDGAGGMYLDDVDKVTIKSSKITGNNSNGGAYGGGAYIESLADEVLIDKTTISGNSNVYDAYYGGGLYLEGGDVKIQDSTISGNFADGYGAGIYNYQATLKILRSAINRNASTYYGAGLYDDAGDTKISNTTLSGNSAYSYGGGVYADGGTVDLNNVTIFHNVSYEGSSGIGFYETSATVTFSNSIIARNRYEGGSSFYDCYGGTSDGNNLVSSDSGCNTTGDDIVDDPRLLPLEKNGGSTLSHMPDTGSKALGAGGPGCENEDQRGKSRANACDLGAIER